MSAEERGTERSASGIFIGVIALVFLVAVGALVWCFELQNHVTVTEKRLADADSRNTQLAERLDETNAKLRATTETLGQSVGMTQKQIEDRTESILASQRAETARLERQQAATRKQIGAVSSDVENVKTDVGGVKTDVATTKSDLETTKTQLNRMVGDAGVMSGLIATNHGELEILKHKGDRNYYEFNLQKGAKPILISTIKLQLKKVDTKRSRFTLNVSADDRNIEKKDKNIDEPVQFYTGKDPMLYEIVVNSMEKNRVSGYLATPKNAPQMANIP
jgi:chromosome segregation ATPase